MVNSSDLGQSNDPQLGGQNNENAPMIGGGKYDKFFELKAQIERKLTLQDKDNLELIAQKINELLEKDPTIKMNNLYQNLKRISFFLYPLETSLGEESLNAPVVIPFFVYGENDITILSNNDDSVAILYRMRDPEGNQLLGNSRIEIQNNEGIEITGTSLEYINQIFGIYELLPLEYKKAAFAENQIRTRGLEIHFNIGVMVTESGSIMEIPDQERPFHLLDIPSRVNANTTVQNDVVFRIHEGLSSMRRSRNLTFENSEQGLIEQRGFNGIRRLLDFVLYFEIADVYPGSRRVGFAIDALRRYQQVFSSMTQEEIEEICGFAERNFGVTSQDVRGFIDDIRSFQSPWVSNDND